MTLSQRRTYLGYDSTVFKAQLAQKLFRFLTLVTNTTYGEVRTYSSLDQQPLKLNWPKSRFGFQL